MTSQEMMKAKAPKGYWFVNVSKIDEPQNWIIQPMPEDCVLNSPFKIFGYEQTEFLAKQYK